MMSMQTPFKKLTILITCYLDENSLKDGRYKKTISSTLNIRQRTNDEIYFSLTGDLNICQSFMTDLRDENINFNYFNQSSKLAQYGKGRLEAELIKNSIAHWKFHERKLHILKITAKYVIENLEQVLVFLRKSDKELVSWYHIGKKLSDTRVFFFSADMYLREFHYFSTINDSSGTYIEHIIFELSKKYSGKFLLLNRPIITGLSGSTGENVKFNLFKIFLINSRSKIYGYFNV